MYACCQQLALSDRQSPIDYVKKPAERQVLQTAIHDRAAILRSYSLPPGTPADRVRLGREGGDFLRLVLQFDAGRAAATGAP